jgi:micrococcal nuclease
MMNKVRCLLLVTLLIVLGSQLGATYRLAAAQTPCNPDVNGDRVVDLFDLVRVGSRYGSQQSPGSMPRLPEDTNADGVVDIADLVCVSANLGPVFGPVPTVGPAVFATPTPTPTIPAPAECQWAWVEWVVDGDTVRVLLDGEVVRVRYVNVDAPEWDEPYGYEATIMNTALVHRRVVCLERDPREWRDTDRYDRLLRYVWVDGLLAEAELVEAGLAEVVLYRPYYQYEGWLLALQDEAKRECRGIWE